MRRLVLATALAALAPALAQEGGPTTRPTEPEKKLPEKVTTPAGLVLTGQEGWELRQAKGMRVAQWNLPKAEGSKDAELAVFHFQGGAGGVEANMERWLGQFTQPDGKTSKEVAKRSQKDVAGLKVHLVDLSGTYVAESRPGSGLRVNEPDSRLLGAIVEGPNGQQHFIKLIGPAATVKKWEKSFEAFIDALRQEG